MSRLVGDAIFRAFVAADRPVRRRPPLCDEEEEEEEPRKPLMEAPPPLMTTDSEAECILLSEMARTSSTLDLSLIDARWVDTPRPGEVSSLCEATEKLGLAGASSSGASSSSSGASSSSSTTKKAFEARVLALTMEAVVSEIHSWLGGKPSQLRAPAGGKAWSFAVRRAHRDGRRLMSVCRRWRDYVGGNRAFFGRLLVPISQRLPRVAQLHGTATKWMTVDGGRIEKARKERSFRNPERSGGFLEVASLRSRSRSPDDLDQKGEGFGPRRRTTRRDGGEEEKDVVYFFDDDDDDPGRSDDERSSSSSSSSSSDAAFVADADAGYAAEPPMKVRVATAALYLGVGAGASALLDRSFDDVGFVFALATCGTIAATVFEVGRPRTPTRGEAQAQDALENAFLDFAETRLRRTDETAVHKTEIVAAFRRAVPRYRSADASGVPDVQIEAIARRWLYARPVPGNLVTPAGFFKGLAINPEPDVF